MIRFSYFIVVFFIFFSCSLQKKIRTINQEAIKMAVIFESDDVKVIASKELLLRFSRKLLVKDVHYANEVKLLDELNSGDPKEIVLPLKIGKEVELSEKEIELQVTLFPALHFMLKTGRVVLFNKNNQQFEKFYFWKNIKDKQGTETDVFMFGNREEFLSIPVAFGE